MPGLVLDVEEPNPNHEVHHDGPGEDEQRGDNRVSTGPFFRSIPGPSDEDYYAGHESEDPPNRREVKPFPCGSTCLDNVAIELRERGRLCEEQPTSPSNDTSTCRGAYPIHRVSNLQPEQRQQVCRQFHVEAGLGLGDVFVP